MKTKLCPPERSLNVALAVRSVLATTVQSSLPVQSPCQPPNAEPPFGVGDRTTVDPAAKVAVHVAGQSMPAGVERTWPPPAMFTVTLLPVDPSPGGASSTIGSVFNPRMALQPAEVTSAARRNRRMRGTVGRQSSRTNL